MQRSKKNNKASKRSNRRNNRAVSTRWNPVNTRSSAVSRPLVVSDESDARLMFRKTAYLTNGGTPLISAEFNPNCAYDVDPTLGSTETYGFDEYAAFYSYYRVIGYSYELTVTSNVGVPMMAYLTNTNVQVTSTNFSLYTTNPYCHSSLVAPYGGAPTTVKFRGYVPMSKLNGTPAVETADSFRATTTSTPTDKVWLTIAVEALSGTEMYAGYDLKIVMHTRFFSREYDLTATSVISRMQNYKMSREKLALQKKEEESREKTKQKQ